MSATTLSFDYDPDPVFQGEHVRAFLSEDDGRVVLAQDISDEEAQVFLAAVAARMPEAGIPWFDHNTLNRFREMDVVRDWRGRFAREGTPELVSRQAQVDFVQNLQKQIEENEQFRQDFSLALTKTLMGRAIGSLSGKDTMEEAHKSYFYERLIEEASKDPKWITDLLDVAYNTMDFLVGASEDAPED